MQSTQRLFIGVLVRPVALIEAVKELWIAHKAVVCHRCMFDAPVIVALISKGQIKHSKCEELMHMQLQAGAKQWRHCKKHLLNTSMHLQKCKYCLQ